jgi:hypothetical protein
VHSGGTARTAARLALAAERPRRGRLELSAAHAVWTARSGGGLVDLGGAVVLSAVPATGGSGDDVVVRLALPAQTTVSVTLASGDAATLVEALRGSGMGAVGPGVAQLPARRPRWALACLVLGTLWLALIAWLAIAGYSTTATVTGNDGDGFCTVV